MRTVTEESEDISLCHGQTCEFTVLSSHGCSCATRQLMQDAPFLKTNKQTKA